VRQTKIERNAACSYQIEGMQHASFVRSGAPWFTYGQQILIEQKSTTLCTAQRKLDRTKISFK
jgi:hypothetical protein